MGIGIVEGLSHWSVASISTFILIFMAEMGDKSQLVCMTLASRCSGRAVLAGAVAAFALLNAVAVTAGAALYAVLPPLLLQSVVALLFAFFAWHAFRSHPEQMQERIESRGRRGVFAAAFMLTVVSELGDKTQIAVAGLGCTLQPAGVWLGATLALTATSLVGVVAGKSVLKRLPINVLHRLSGALFAVLALVMFVRIVRSW
ncbi:MAG: TMEM165/GDT1 family protein [Deltaproteobacteria bacterium]|nr:TMEM165/GDT1 family protein [Deltaproteobacteria bacterium]